MMVPVSQQLPINMQTNPMSSSMSDQYSMNMTQQQQSQGPPMHLDPMAFTNILGQGRVNQLGGAFINGRPLPHHIRMQIIEMAAADVKPCVISRRLRVSHGCVSKILQRYTETGSIAPGQVGGSRPRMAIQTVEKQIVRIKREKPSMFSWAIREQLIENGIDRSIVPSVSSINRLLRSKGLVASPDQPHPVPPNPPIQQTTVQQQQQQPAPIKPIKYSIHSILGIDEAKKPSQSDNDQKMSDVSHSELDRSVSVSSLQDDTSEEADDEDGSNSARRRNRTSFSTDQLDKLEQSFKDNKYPDAGQREALAESTKLPETKIQVWFSNRRARWRKQMGGMTGLAQHCHPFMFPPMMAPQPMPIWDHHHHPGGLMAMGAPTSAFLSIGGMPMMGSLPSPSSPSPLSMPHICNLTSKQNFEKRKK